jgi:hypothetical protein
MPISFPLRFDDGSLRRIDEATALLKLIEVMARTPHGSWAGSSGFGLRNLMTGAEGRRQPSQAFVQQLNDSLHDLGIDHYRVVSIVREPGSGSEVDEYQVTFEVSGDAGQVRTVKAAL